MRPSQEDTVVIHTNSIDNVNWRHVREHKSRCVGVGGVCIRVIACVARSSHSVSQRDMGICAVFDGHRGYGVVGVCARASV
jgi:hypothetical protein